MSSILKVKDPSGNWVDIPAIFGEKGEKGDTGNSGVYLGSGKMPADCNVQIDPDGEPTTTIEEIAALAASKMSGVVKVKYDAYVGTGTYGINNPNTVSCDFTPFLVIISDSQGAPLILADWAGEPIKCTWNDVNVEYSCIGSCIGHGMKWYSDASVVYGGGSTTDTGASAKGQKNEQGVVYPYIIFGN